jgi:2-oxoglutarate dehydrogenase E1 component
MSLLEQFKASSQLGTGNAAYVDDLYEQWLADANAVSREWQVYFAGLSARDGKERAHGPVIAGLAAAARERRTVAIVPSGDHAYAEKQAGVQKLVTAYRSRGHLGAALDPLGLMDKPAAPDLELEFHGLGDADLDTEFTTHSLSGAPRMKLRDLLAQLKATYSSSIGAEFMHISDSVQRRWFYDRLETAAGKFGFDKARKHRVLERLSAAEGLERYLHTKYVGQKRFSLEGGESLIPLLDGVIQKGGAEGVKEIVIGMAHRGRINVLINTLGKAPGLLFDEFEGKHEVHHDPAHSGDVKYHMGYSADVRTPGGAVHLALAFNPSHLEIVDPVVAGSVRARQTRRNDEAGAQVLPILIHGDAAFAGQGVVMELFNMSQARGFAVGGTLHVVINNQVGFTTSRPDDARSTFYCTDIAKMVGAPIIHVNGDDAEACLFVAELAFAYRREFKRDIVIDLICYRRHGHNEADEPAATQPLMYQNIRARKSTRELYADHLVATASLTADEAKALTDNYRNKLDKGESVTELSKPDDGMPHIEWHHLHDGKLSEVVVTGVAPEKLKVLSDRINTIPADWSLHARVAKVYDDRVRMGNGELRMDWGYAETLAYATLIDEGFKLRVVGQDAGRGTFFHRHAVIHDQKTGEAHFPLRSLAENPKSVAVIDSVLSEEAVMGFEYGYSTADPQTLVIWEGQFGDFANGAQVVIDQFISSGEAKWGRLCGTRAVPAAWL